MIVDQPLVSVIVPIYGVEKYLDICIASIVNQTYRNLEILLIDDGSLDSCPQICESWAAKDSRISVYHKKNGGLSDARNYGLDRAKGEYIYCVDSDDWIETSLIEECLAVLEQNKADIAIFEYYTSDESGTHIHLSSDAEKFPPEGLYNASEIMKYLWEDKLLNFAWSFLAKRDIYSTDIRFPVNALMEDMGTTYKLWSRAKKIFLLQKPLYYYRTRGGSILGKKGKKLSLDTVAHIRAIDDFARANYPELSQYEFDWSIRYLGASLIWAYESKSDFTKTEYRQFCASTKRMMRKKINQFGFSRLSTANKIKATGLLLNLTPFVVLISQFRDNAKNRR